MAGKIFKTNNVLHGDGSPGGSTKHVQFNDSDAFGGAAQLFWDKVNNRLGLGTTSLFKDFHIFNSTQAQLLIQTATANTGDSASLLFKTTPSTADTYIKAGIIFERDSSAYGRGDLHFAVDGGANAGNVAISDAVMTLRHEGNIGIGIQAPATSALLDLTSTTGALLLTRMTTAQKNALTAINGMIVYDSTLGKFQTYEAGVWVSLGGTGNPGGSDTQVQFNNGSAFGGDVDFTWTLATNILNLANAEICSKDSTTGDFTLDATPLVHAWTWDYRAANLIQNRQAQVLATDGTSHSFSAGLALHHVDSDGTNYKTSGTIHQMYGLECQLAGTTTSASYKDMVGVFSRVMNRTEWSSSAGDCGRGCGGFQTEVHQYGAGIADNEFHIFDPSAGAEGGHAQSKSIAGLQIVLHHHFANEDATHISRGLMVDTFGKRITSGITMSSNANAYGSGYAKHAIDMSALKTSSSGIKMPSSVSGSTGTYIEYDPNDYTYYSRSTNAYAWIIGGSQKFAVSAYATDVAGTLNVAGATNLYGKLSIGPGVNTEYDSGDYSWYDRTSNVFNWVVGGVTGLLVGGSANAVAIRVNSTLLYISRSADVDGTGKHYLVVS